MSDLEAIRARAAARKRRAEAERAQGFPTPVQGYLPSIEDTKTATRAALVGAADTASLGLSDEMSGALQGGISFARGDGYLDAYGQERDRVREGQAELREDAPGAYFGGQLAGGVAPGVLMAKGFNAARGLFPFAKQATPTLGRQVVAGGGLGAAEGGMYAAGSAEGGAANRIQDGAWGAGIGGALGAAVPLAAALGRQGVSAFKGSLRGSRVGNQVAKEAGISPESGRVVARLVGEESPDMMQDALRRAGPDAMLADASPGTAGMLDATMRSPAPGAAIARQRVDDRAGQAYYGVVDALNGNKQGPRMPPVATQSAMRASAKPKIDPAYAKAYATPIDYSTPEGRAVEDILKRAPRDTVRSATKKAIDRMIYDGIPQEQIMARISDSGEVVMDEMPNTIMADYIKRAFDEIAESSKDVTGKMTPDGAFANRIARDLRGAIADAVPDYDEALSLAATDIRGRAAVREGQKLLNSGVFVEDAMETIKDATPAELRAIKDGVRGQIDHVMGNVRAVASDQNIDARQAMKAYTDLSSPNSKQKMQALFGDDYPAIQEQLDQAGSALGLRARVAGNSSTQPRQVADQMIADEVQPGVVRSLQPIATAREAGQRALGSDPASVARLSDNVKSELADYLSRTGGQGNEALSAVVRALSDNPINPNAGQGTQRALNAAGIGSTPALTERLQRTLGLQAPR